MVQADVIFSVKSQRCSLQRAPACDYDACAATVKARSDASSVKEGIACGAAAYFVKPIDVDKLVEKVSELTGVEKSAH